MTKPSAKMTATSAGGAAKSSAPRGRRVGRGSWTERWTSSALSARVWRFAAKGLLVAGVAAAVWASLEMRRRVLAFPWLQCANWELRLGAFPEWVTPAMRAEIESLRRSAVLGPDAAGSVVEANLLARVRDEIVSHPWIRSVRSIRLVYPGQDPQEGPRAGGIEIDLELRRPIAAVRWSGAYHLVDEEGFALGGAIADAAELPAGLPAIVGTERIAVEPAPASGGLWTARQVLEGLDVARALFAAGIAARYPASPVDEIDVGNIGNRRLYDQEIVLRVRDIAAPLAWGRSRLSPGARVLPVADKIANLERILAYDRSRLARVTLVRLYTEDLASDAVSTAPR